eukprot:TRINITY_DN22600_c0_g1_i1.p1 TRINITY_DN22600_c0_g1~~TRINITY_DN22600_c0_g1_i1.p1  ORF type:complete len:272 (-),score=15.63 TRINITY_DN22600_c0_g1_i1:105-920(-)
MLGVPACHTRRAAVAAVIRYHQPDIVGTQEGLLWQLRDISTDLHHQYGYIGRPRGTSWKDDETSAVFFNKLLWRVLDSGDFMLSPTPHQWGSSHPGASYAMISTWASFAEVDRESCQMLVVNTHLDPYNSSVRTVQAAQLVAFMKERRKEHGCRRYYLMGDFNADFTEPCYALLQSAGFADLYRQVHGRYQPGSFTYHAFEADMYKPEGLEFSDPDHPIDFIMAWSDHENVTRASFDKRRFGPWSPGDPDGVLPSDHYPLVVDVSPKILGP